MQERNSVKFVNLIAINKIDVCKTLCITVTAYKHWIYLEHKPVINVPVYMWVFFLNFDCHNSYIQHFIIQIINCDLTIYVKHYVTYHKSNRDFFKKIVFYFLEYVKIFQIDLIHIEFVFVL